jgi:uncharacterized protein
MVRLQNWQWGLLIAPIALVVAFLLFSAGYQIHEWGLTWVWALLPVVFLGWRWLLVRWTRPAIDQMAALMADLNAELGEDLPQGNSPVVGSRQEQAEAVLYQVLAETRADPPVWQDWNLFWRRALSLVSQIAQVYNPQAKKPLLNIYIPQAYGLMRGTMDDLNLWMLKMTPALNQVTVEQAFEAYELYQKMQPSMQRLFRLWQWSQWIRNPIAALTRTASQGSRSRATQELLGNFSQMMRETVLRNLAQQAIALYSGETTAVPLNLAPTQSPDTQSPDTQTLATILTQAKPEAQLATQPLNILLVGRTGSGKSSVVNTLFTTPQAQVDAMPSTDRIQDYHWKTDEQDGLVLWDTPGYEQVGRSDLRTSVLEKAQAADLILLVTPASDPAIQMDRDFLADLQSLGNSLPPMLGIVTQVDRLRPFREWDPPYDWQQGKKPKEVSIREAVTYRNEVLPLLPLLPLVALDGLRWGDGAIAEAILGLLPPAKQARLGRFFKARDSRVAAAAGIIDRYSQRMTLQRGITAFLKSPVLQVLAAITAGSPAYAPLLAEKIPAENLPLVLGKAQMAYELYLLLAPPLSLEWLKLWPLIVDHSGEPGLNAWAFGHSLTAYWSGITTEAEDLPTLFKTYRSQKTDPG